MSTAKRKRSTTIEDESVCVTKGDDAPVIRVFIDDVALIVVNVWLATKHFYAEGWLLTRVARK
jgi:hypothetical protein